MFKIEFKEDALTTDERRILSEGFARHSEKHSVPAFIKQPLKWLAYDAHQKILGIATAHALWDWIYIEDLWVDENVRGTGLGTGLVRQIEHYAGAKNFVGVWLWTQSWQAPEFYRRIGYQEFSRLDDFPKGHARIGFRKLLGTIQ